MVKGMNSYDDKERRKVRRRNHIARDLAKPKFRQQIVKNGRPQRPPPEIDEWSDELYDGDDDE